MKLELDVNLHLYDSADALIMQRLDHILAMLQAVLLKENVMAGELDALKAEVERNTSVDRSAIILLRGLAQKIEELKTQPQKLQELANSLKGSSDELAQAIVENTPAENSGNAPSA